MTALRLYGLVPHDGTPAAGEHAESGVRIVAYRHLGALVANSAYEQISPEEPELRRYREIVEEEFSRRNCLPAPFGIVFRNEDVLTRWMELHYSHLLDGLAFVEDRMTARVRADRVLVREAAARAPDALVAAGPAPAVVAPRRSSGNGPGARRGVRLSGARALAEDGEEAGSPADAFRNLRRLAVASVTLKPDAGGARETASFLLDRDRWEAFGDALLSEAKRSPDWEYSISGPWPPYDFVRMHFGSTD